MQPSAQMCREIVRKSSSTFALAFRSLDGDALRAMRAVYAFCRVVDDIVDSAAAARDKRARLDAWRKCVDVQMCRSAAVKTSTQASITTELHWASDHFPINPKYFTELIDGVACDIDPAPIETCEDLLHYCYGVAGTVGLLCLPIFGVVEDARTRAAAIDLARAFQLTNILRDLREDALLGRCYLPQVDLRDFGVRADWLANAPCNGSRGHRVMELLTFESARAQAFYANAWNALTPEETRKMRPAVLMSRAYHALLEKITADPLASLRRRTTLTPWQKVALVRSAWMS